MKIEDFEKAKVLIQEIKNIELQIESCEKCLDGKHRVLKIYDYTKNQPDVAIAEHWLVLNTVKDYKAFLESQLDKLKKQLDEI